MPYFNSLISEGSDIIIISEHWLWPYDLHRLMKYILTFRAMDSLTQDFLVVQKEEALEV